MKATGSFGLSAERDAGLGAVPLRYGHAYNVSDVSPLDYLELAYLRDGRYRCVEAALAVLHATGHVKAGQRGTIARDAATLPPPEGLERVIWRAVHGHVAPGALAARGPVDAELNALRRDLRRRGVIRPLIPVRSWLPARTHRGRQRYGRELVHALLRLRNNSTSCS